MISNKITDNNQIIKYLEKLNFEYMIYTEFGKKSYVYESDAYNIEIDMKKDSNGVDTISIFYTVTETKQGYVGTTHAEVIQGLNSLFKHKLRKISIQKLLNDGMENK